MLESGMARNLRVIPTTIREANEFIRNHHRHHRPTARNSGKWALAALDVDDHVVGVLIAASPVSAAYMDGLTLEVSRLCVVANAPKGTCSYLLSKCCAVWRLMGGRKVLTYTLQSETGASLRGAGWVLAGSVKPHKRWEGKSRCDGIQREPLAIYQVPKYRWEKNLREATL
jgi:hypothetical protein|tara:strand:- start:532 stop:1044 length:513 start_codon:yes stop_codon:yes gene_type:complete